ncbi:MAG: NAD-dependent epimerase/dehydratase family protein [Gemmatimonadetes bacterium]|nr:NAD-dependent epimerase/dehydratase family protein [Gemmatimonadota bacterium]
MPDRRSFLKAGAFAAGALSLGPQSVVGQAAADGFQEPSRQQPRALDILILGGTSFLGPHQVHLALQRGHSVSTFTRGRTEPRMYRDDFGRVEALIGDREDDLGALEGRRWDVVIDNSTRQASWAEATVELLRDAAEHYVFVSSTGVYYPYLTEGVTENGPVPVEDSRGGEDGSMAYGVMKAQGEEAVRSGFGERAIVLRPGHIAGPGDTQPARFPYWTTRMERGGEVLAPGRRSDPVQIVDVRDLTDFMFHLFENGVGGTYNVVGPASAMTMEGFLYGMRACTGTPVELVWADDPDWLQENRLTGLIPWVLPQGDELAHMSVDGSRALAAGLALRPLARTAFDVMEWWHSDVFGAEARAGVRFRLDAETEAELISAWRSRGRGNIGDR